MDKVRLLVVDDEPIRFLIGRALTMLGYQVSMAASGEEALSLDGGTFDLMLLDMQLPGMNGLEVISLARKKWPNIRIIVLTGFATIDNAVAAFKLEAVDYLQKPVRLNDLIDAVSNAVQNRQAYRQKMHLTRFLEADPHLLAETNGAVEAALPAAQEQADVLFVRPLLLNRARLRGMSARAGVRDRLRQFVQSELVLKYSPWAFMFECRYSPVPPHWSPLLTPPYLFM